MRVLVACEYSGRVRDAFIAKGHDAVSCDLLPTRTEGPHYEGDVRDLLSLRFDLMIAFPPCTYLTTTGGRWFYHPDDKHLPRDERRAHPLYPNRRSDREQAVAFFRLLAEASIHKIAIENPVGAMSTIYRKPDQIIQPYQFGHDASKATCLWLKNLPPLLPTKIVPVTRVTTSTGKTFSKWYWDTSQGKGAERQLLRSLTFSGIAEAMAAQWGR